MNQVCNFCIQSEWIKTKVPLVLLLYFSNYPWFWTFDVSNIIQN